MNWSKTPPTEPGNYWWRLQDYITPRVMYLARGNTGLELSTDAGLQVNPSYIRGEWGDRIEFPGGKVPGDVMRIVELIRQDIRINDKDGVGASTFANTDVKKLCDYIDPPKELPLPRRFRGTWRGASCVGAVTEEGKIVTQMADGGCSLGGRNIGEIENLEWIDGEQP